MLTRAYCHSRGVTLSDDRGRSHGFSFVKEPRHPKSARSARRVHSESECIALRAWQQGEAGAAFDGGRLTLAVLPPDFTLPPAA